MYDMPEGLDSQILCTFWKVKVWLVSSSFDGT